MGFRNFKVFIRHISKNKLYALVSIFGFSVSFMFIVLISAYIKQENAVDEFHINKDRLFRLVNKKDSRFGATVGNKISNALPEVENYTRVYYNNEYFSTVQLAGEKLNAEVLLVDSSFLNLFSFKILEGNRNDALKTNHSILLTLSYARALFGDVSPVGKQLKSSNGDVLHVTGIIEEAPENTQFEKYDVVANIHLLPGFMGWKEVLNNDNMSDFTYYFLAKKGTNLQAKEEQALALLKKDMYARIFT